MASPYQGTGLMPGIAEKARHMAGITNWVHPAVALLPPAGSAHLDMREETPDGEIQHQCELQFPEQAAGKDFSLAETAGLTVAKRKPPPFAVPIQNDGLMYSKDQLKEWGYSTYEAKYDDPEWLSQQFHREYTDPRENPNFFLNHEDPEFWNNAARKPHMKALLQSDDHWKLRRNTWLEQYQQVKESNDFRRELTESLEECSLATKRLLTPIIHCRPVESHLMNVVGQAKERGVPFPQLVETAENQRILMDFRNTFDHEGEAGIDRIFQGWHHREIKQKAETSNQIVKAESSMKEVHDGLSFATKYRKDGLVEWERGNHEDALKAWRLGCDALERIRVPYTHSSEQRFFSDVKLALLKNRALAALKLNSWQEALDSSEQVLKLDDQDHKAWFRKACALEGLGRLKEVEACLNMIDGIAVGRPDRDRLERETSAKREKVKALISKDELSQQRMFQLGLEKGLFSEERSERSSVESTQPLYLSGLEAKTKPQLDDLTRKRLTREGAEDMLKELEHAYSEPSFREQVRKLARDVQNKDEFTCYLARVALPVQKPVLEHWGFEATELGVIEMQCAIDDHSETLKRQAEATQRALFGEMYNAVRGKSTAPVLPEKERLKQAEKRLQRRLKKDDSADASDEEPQDIVKDASCLYAHWRQPVAAQAVQSGHVESAKRIAPVSPESHSSDSAVRAVSISAPAVSARKEIWAELSKAQKGNDARRLRAALEKAAQAGFSAVTIRSAKQALLKLGGSIEGL